MSNTPWKVDLDDAAAKELGKLDRETAIRLLRFMQERLATPDDPRSRGGALTTEGKFWKYRIGDYRIVWHIEDAGHCIVVLVCGHRREIYRRDWGGR